MLGPMQVAACMGELQAAGLIRAWGVSNESSFGVATWCVVALQWCPHV